jgi:RNA 3'-terminal phosphate cyclase (ATP)
MPQTGALVVIEGSYGEGGGAVLRTALCMAALTQQPTRVLNVRGGTRFPGLDAEDVTLIQALTDACGAEVTGLEIGSQTLTFLPSRKARGLTGPLHTTRSKSNRGANTLVVLGSLIPVLAKTGMYSSISAEGETYGSNALSYDYFAGVTLHALRAFGLYAYPTLETAGFGRESDGEVSIDIEPSVLNGVQWTERGKLLGVNAVVATGSVPSTIGARALGHLKQLAQSANLPLTATHQEVASKSPGVFVTIWATYENGAGGGAAMGARGIRVEALAQTAFTQLIDWMSSDATVDPFLCDQILLAAVLAEGETIFKVSRLTQRFLTTAWVVKQFTPIHITIRGNEDGPGRVTVRR